jgi:hypothetical protein
MQFTAKKTKVYTVLQRALGWGVKIEFKFTDLQVACPNQHTVNLCLVTVSNKYKNSYWTYCT